LLPADKMIDEAALDKYSYIRSAYLQRRRSLIYDGNPPRDRDDD
jgi:phospholipid-binding lipoprotein MlaA